MTCPATLGNSGTLTCTRTDEHPEHHGCVYVASSLPDLKHDAVDSAQRQDEVAE